MLRPTRVLFPPRPKGKMDPLLELDNYDKQGTYIAQRKYNGTRTLVWIPPEQDRIVLYDRYGEVNNYQFAPNIQKEILSSLRLEKIEYWFDGELLHYKTKNIKDTLVLFDILWAGKFLFGMNQMKRIELLNWTIAANNLRVGESYPKNELGDQVCPGVILSEIFVGDFMKRYEESFDLDWCEGLVLRQKDSILDCACAKIDDTVKWQKRCRKPHKNYAF